MILQAPGPGSRKRKAAEPGQADLFVAAGPPAAVVTRSFEEWNQWMARAKAGEVIIESVSVVPGNNGFWRLGLRWPVR